MRSRRLLAISVAVLVLIGGSVVALAMWPPADPTVVRPAPPLWRTYLDAVDAALAAHEGPVAVRAWREAWVAALATARGEPLIEVGDAAVRLGEATGERTARADARVAYRAALLRARAERSVAGVLCAAQAFAALGDRGPTEVALRMARQLAADSRSPDLRQRVELEAAAIVVRDAERRARPSPPPPAIEPYAAHLGAVDVP
jgi:hypothetical protein